MGDVTLIKATNALGKQKRKETGFYIERSPITIRAIGAQLGAAKAAAFCLINARTNSTLFNG